MCPPTAWHLDALDPNVKKLVMDVAHRRDFGIGASPGGRAIYIQFAIQDGLVKRDGYFAKSGQPRWIVTPCGRRVGRFLLQRSQQADPTLLDMDYNSGSCPLDELPETDYHEYEDWQQNPSRESRLRRWEQIKSRTQPKIEAWIQSRIDEQRPITYRFLSRLAADYAERQQIPQQWAVDHLFECGVRNILVTGPTDLANYPTKDSWLRPTADWMWQRRDLRKPFQ